MPAGLHDDQQFGEFGLSNDEGAARKRAGLAADFEAQVAAKRARIAAQEEAGQDAAGQVGVKSPDDALSPDGEQTSPAIEERVFSERVAYGDVRHMSKSFYKGLIASIVVVVIIVAVIVILGRTAL